MGLQGWVAHARLYYTMGTLIVSLSLFAYSYKELKGVLPYRCQHRIWLHLEVVPKRMRSYMSNPKYNTLIKVELDSLLEVGFIYPVHESDWASPILVMPKKSGKIRICVDYKKLNKYTIPNAFPLPYQDCILDNVARFELFSLMDGFSGYNQIIVHLKDQLLTSFVTEWGMFAYRVMGFGLQNAGATFQRYMIESFKHLLHSVEIYLDESMKYDHLSVLRMAFTACKNNRISLNPEKCVFGAAKGPLLGHIISGNGIEVNLEKVREICELPPHATIKQVRSFLGCGSYYVRFIKLYAKVASSTHDQSPQDGDEV